MASDIANTSFAGNAMVEIRKVFTKVETKNDEKGRRTYVYFSNVKLDSGFECYWCKRADGTYNEYGYAPYYTLDEANGNFTLPQGEIYGMMLNQSVPHVVESYQNGTSWYRVWSDGWCEQGGGVYIAGATGGGDITLLKAYANIDYSIMLTNSNYMVNSTPGVTPNSKTTTGFSVDYPIAEAVSDVYWETKGYINI